MGTSPYEEQLFPLILQICVEIYCSNLELDFDVLQIVLKVTIPSKLAST